MKKVVGTSTVERAEHGGGNKGDGDGECGQKVVETMEVLETMKVVEMMSTVGTMKAVESDWHGGDDEGGGDDERGGAHGSAENDECGGDGRCGER